MKKIIVIDDSLIILRTVDELLRKEGFEGVHHLHGGILRYLEVVSEKESLWKGECFVFDQRVALNHQLLPGDHLLCFACGMPLNSLDRDNSSYIPGIQCHHCEDIFNDSDRARFSERQRQFDQHKSQLFSSSCSPKT